MFTVKIMTSGAAFRDDSSGHVDASGNYPLDPTACEIRRLLKLISQNLEEGYTGGIAFDYNGNKVGEWKLEEKSETTASAVLFLMKETRRE